MSAEDERFVSLYEQHYRQIYAYCRRRTTADQVDDVVADVFVTAWRRLDDLPEGERALPWLYGVAYRVVGHSWRGMSRYSKLRRKLDGVGLEAVQPPDDYLVRDEESRQITTALSRLGRRDQELLRLSVWEELGHAEIANALGLSHEAVRKRFSRARRNLAREYNRMEERGTKTPVARKGGAW